MAQSPVLVKLDELKMALRQVEYSALPEEARSPLKFAQEALDALSEGLVASQEQGRLAALYRVSQALGTSLDLDQVLTQVMDAVIGLTGAERGFLVLLEPGEGGWRLRAARNYSQETLRPKDMEISRTVVNSVLENGAGLVTTDAQTDPRFAGQDSVIYYALRSILCAPLMVRGRPIGAIYVDNRALTGLFSAEDLELLNAFAAQAAIAIENARLYTRTDRSLTQRVAELETLSQIDRELNNRLDLDYVVEITRKWALQANPDGQVWLLIAEQGNQPDFIVYPQDFASLQDDVIQQALTSYAASVSVQSDGSQSRAVLPLLYAGTLLGLAVVDRPTPFAEEDLEFLGQLAGRAASAVQNARLHQAVQQANQAKSKFVSVVTHELRIPMTSIKGYTDLLRQGVVGPVNEQQLSFLNVVKNNVDRMSALVSDLSDISRIETGRLKLECRQISVQEYIEDTLRGFNPRLEEKQQTLEADIPADLQQVYADPNRLMQILANLVNNAVKYTPSGGRIRVAVRDQGEFVRIEVADSGIGISIQDQVNIFTQFFRSEDPVVREEQGWGLGLNVARRLAEVMGGQIGFESTTGLGSIFWFTLPTQEDRCNP